MTCTHVPDKHCVHAGCLEALSAAAVTPNVGINFQKHSHEGGATLVPSLGRILVLMWKCAVEVDPTMVLNADQCRAKADDCLDAARHALYLDQRRLYEEIAEQWLLLAEQMGQKTNGHNGGQGSDLSRTSKTGH